MKSAILVALIHALLAAALLFGLAGDQVRKAAIATVNRFELIAPPPPSLQPPPPAAARSAPRDPAGAANRRARPAPVLLPTPPVPLPSPLPVSDTLAPTSGSDRSAGAAGVRGAGQGAGGSGAGDGGGGSGGYGSNGGGIGAPARLLGGNRARLPAAFLAQLGFVQGQASLRLTVSVDGRITACRPTVSSGNAVLDDALCRIMAERSRWAPARDRDGHPITVEVGYTATFSQ